ncbi:hypothetical protein EDC94DRAFT_581483 [Helicostylum pulchrum]|nr:hypothetical protein EDC94DRAFT_581483 [Helicostylum pulchrum]
MTFNIHYFNSKYQQEEVYSKGYVISKDVGILSDIKRKFGKDGKIETKKEISKIIEIVDYEDILISILHLQSNYPEDFIAKHGFDVKITNIINQIHHLFTLLKKNLQLMTDESEVFELKIIRSRLGEAFKNIQYHSVVLLYLHVIHNDSKCIRGMFYNLDDNYLFMEEIECKLGDWYKPGDSIRFLCPKTGSYRLIVDEYNFYAAMQSILPETSLSDFKMELFINGAEPKK